MQQQFRITSDGTEIASATFRRSHLLLRIQLILLKEMALLGKVVLLEKMALLEKMVPEKMVLLEGHLHLKPALAVVPEGWRRDGQVDLHDQQDQRRRRVLAAEFSVLEELGRAIRVRKLKMVSLTSSGIVVCTGEDVNHGFSNSCID